MWIEYGDRGLFYKQKKAVIILIDDKSKSNIIKLTIFISKGG